MRFDAVRKNSAKDGFAHRQGAHKVNVLPLRPYEE